MLSVIDLQSIKFECTYPFTRNKQGRMVQEPYFAINESNNTYHLKGRLLMWSFLDSLYSKDPLPRGPVEDDIFAPTIGTPSMLSLFTEFAEEASVTNRYMVFEHDDNNNVSIVRNLEQYVFASNDIEKVGSVLNGFGLNVEYRPTVYIDSQKNHLRPALFCRIGKHTLRVIDIGSSYYISVTSVDLAGHRYSLVAPCAISKKNKDSTMQSCIQDVVDVVHLRSLNTFAVANTLITIPPVNENPHLLTRELDTLLHDRLRRCI